MCKLVFGHPPAYIHKAAAEYMENVSSFALENIETKATLSDIIDTCYSKPEKVWSPKNCTNRYELHSLPASRKLDGSQ